MPNINEITSAAYRLLKADDTLRGICTIYSGAKRPILSRRPALTVETRCMEPGAGEGIWMCNVVTTAYAKLCSDGAPDHAKLEEIIERARAILDGAELALASAKTLALFAGGDSPPEWDAAHDREASRESVYGLIFISFDTKG